MDGKMTRYTFKCKDIGYQDCSYELNVGTKDEIFSNVRMHAKYAHGFYDFTDELKTKVENVINKVD